MAAEKFMGNVIKKNDVENYEILLPFSAIAGKRRKQFLCSELEKMHPCFSDEFAFDSAVRAVKRNGVFEDVVVMNKFKLAEYEGKRHFAGTGFFIENNSEAKGEGKSDDKSDGKIHILRRRFFMNDKWKLCLRGLGIGFILLVCGIVGMKVVHGSGGVVDATKTNETSEISATSEALVAEEYSCPAEISFFDAVSEAGGKVGSFEWKIDGFYEMFSASLRGIFPEKLGDVTADAVVYEKGIPQMSVSHKTRCPSAENKGLTEDFFAAVEITDFNKHLRETLVLHGAVLKEERIRPSHIEFICVPECQTAKLFDALAQLIADAGRCVTFISVNQIGPGELRAGISIESNGLRCFDLGLISRNLPLFFDEEKFSKRKVVAKLPVTEKKEAAYETLNVRKKIGEIKKPGNTTVVFYKNEKGKMEVEK